MASNGIKILMVDDDKMLIDLYKERLELAGFTVEISRDGEEGLAKVHETKPDLVLLDIMMPKVNGYEALASIKSDPATKDIPVIILSALMRDINKSKAIDAGADDYIIKSEAMPVDVIKKIETVLQKYNKMKPEDSSKPPKEEPPNEEPEAPKATSSTESPEEKKEEQNINFEPAAGGQDLKQNIAQDSAVPSAGPIVAPEPPKEPISVPETPVQNQNLPVAAQQVPQASPAQEPKASPLVVFFLILIVILILASDVYFYLSLTQVK